MIIIIPFINSSSILCHITSINQNWYYIIALFIRFYFLFNLICCCCPYLIFNPMKSLLISDLINSRSICNRV
nr:MAG TPA: hypothetical protein [Caudoviricetes sp.]